MQRTIQSKLTFFTAFLMLGLTILGSEAQAAENEYTVSLFCAPQENTVDSSGRFTQVSGTIVTIVCEITDSMKDRAVSAILLGKQTYEGASLSTLGNDVVLTGNMNAETTLPFPAVFQSGEYQYTFSLIDKETQKVITQEAYLVGTIKGDTPRVKIASAIVSEGQHQWQGPFDLTTTFDIPEGYDFQANPLSLHVGMQDTNGDECAVLLQKHFIRTDSQKLGLVFPEEGNCVNGMIVSLHDKTSAVVDQKILAVGLPNTQPATDESSPTQEMEILKGIPLAIQVGLAITVILIVTLIGYFLLRRQKRTF